jgi:hypothetical protein
MLNYVCNIFQGYFLLEICVHCWSLSPKAILVSGKCFNMWSQSFINHVSTFCVVLLYFCLVWNLLSLASYLSVYFINSEFILSSPGTLQFFNYPILMSTCRSVCFSISFCGVHITTIYVQPYHPLLIYTVVWSLRYLPSPSFLRPVSLYNIAVSMC